MGSYRPGIKALKELGIKSPLSDAGLTKKEIRKYSRQLKLPIWNKPPFSCLLTRFPYDESISESKLIKIKKAEIYIHSLGFKQTKVNYNYPVARIETGKEEAHLMLDSKIRKKIISMLKKIGFKYICLDLEAYRSGSMNE